MKRLLLVSALLALSFATLAQKGFVRGKVTDGETGEGLYGASIMKQGTGVGVITDFDGNYSLSLDPGTHTIVLTFVSYQTQTLENIEVKAGEVTTLDLIMQSDVKQLGEVVV